MTTNSSLLDTWRKIYYRTWQIHQMAPWEELSRAALIGVKYPPTAELGFLSVSDDPSFRFISIYRGARGLYGFWYSHDMPLPDYPEQYLEIPQIQIDFKNYDDLVVEDLRLLAELGLDAGYTKEYPVFRSVIPGFRPWFLEDEEVDFLLCVLEQAIQVLPRAMDNPDFLLPQAPDRFPVRVQDAAGTRWSDTLISIPQPGYEPIQFMMDMPLLEKVKKFPHSEIQVEIDFFLLTGLPVHPEEAGKRPHYPYILLTVDAALGMILGHESLSASPTVEEMWGLVGWKLIAQIDKLGAIPHTVFVRSPILIQILASFSQMLKFKLKEAKILPGVDAARGMLDQMKDHQP